MVSGSGKLNISNVLMHKGIQQNMVCSLCNCQGESNSHLFLTCPLPSFLWEEIQQELHVHCLPMDMGDLWSEWWQLHISQSVMLEWDRPGYYLVGVA